MNESIKVATAVMVAPLIGSFVVLNKDNYLLPAASLTQNTAPLRVAFGKILKNVFLYFYPTIFLLNFKPKHQRNKQFKTHFHLLFYPLWGGISSSHNTSSA